jgi:carboxyl-terminal processing protease
LTIVSPLVGSPAYRAGLLAGDRIVEIDGTSTEGITIDEAIKRLKGPVDSTVTIGVVHPGAREPEDVVLKREMVHVATVLGDRRNADDSWNYLVDPEHRIGYIRITAFSRETARELRDVLERLVAEKVAGLVVDVRFNPGGLLTSAIEASDLFIDEGTIVSTEGRNVKSHVWKARRDHTFRGFPVAVLVNRYSASASEILAACLQDHKRAVVVGERTWGKGSVQNVVELNGGRSALKLTTASYLRPSGKNIHRMPGAGEDDPWGVLPDDGFEVRLSPQEIRLLSQLQYDRNIVRRGELSDGDDAENDENTDSEADDGESDFVDRQLQKAVEHLVAQLSAED